MSFSLVFWILMLLWLIGGIYQNYPNLGWPAGHNLLLFILLLLLGWSVFGAPIR